MQSPSIRAATAPAVMDSPDMPKKERTILKRWEKVQKLLDDATTSPTGVRADMLSTVVTCFVAL